MSISLPKKQKIKLKKVASKESFFYALKWLYENNEETILPTTRMNVNKLLSNNLSSNIIVKRVGMKMQFLS
jgi:hypothetical protein